MDFREYSQTGFSKYKISIDDIVDFLYRGDSRDDVPKFLVQKLSKNIEAVSLSKTLKKKKFQKKKIKFGSP